MALVYVVYGAKSFKFCEKLGKEIDVPVINSKLQKQDELIQKIQGCSKVLVSTMEEPKWVEELKEVKVVCISPCTAPGFLTEMIKKEFRNELFTQFANGNRVFRDHVDTMDGYVDSSAFNNLTNLFQEPPRNTLIEIPFSKIHPSCPNFVASKTPLNCKDPSEFWLQVEKHSPVIIQLNEDASYLERAPLKKVATEKLMQGVVKTTLELSSKTITHYHVQEWKDGRAFQDPSTLDCVIGAVKKHIDADPSITPLVHCLMGEGRTGTFLGAYLKRHFWIDKPDIPLDKKTFVRDITIFMRMYRDAIHTDEQYLSLANYEPK